MNIHSLPILLASITTLFLAIFVYAKGRNVKVNRDFALFMLCMAFWNIDILGIRLAPNDDSAELWGKIFRPGLIFLPATFLRFVVSFIRPQTSIPKYHRHVLQATYFTALLFSLLNWTPYFTGDAVRYPWGYTVQSGPAYFYFIVSFIAFMLVGVGLLIHNYFESELYQKHRIRYFILALIISFFLGIFNFLPMFGFEVYPFGNLAILGGSIILSYTIVQHRLMDFSMFMAKGLSYILCFTILAIPYSFLILLLEESFFKRTEIPFTLIIIFLGVTSILVFEMLKARMDRTMHHLVIKDKYNYHQILRDFSRRLVTIVDLDRLLNMLADTIEKSMGVQKISIFLVDPEKKNFRPRLLRDFPKGEPITISEPAIQFLQDRREAILRIELDWVENKPVAKELAALISQFETEVFLPLIFMDRLIGFITLGPKAEEQIYYPEDLNLLYPLANQVAIAIENSNLYDSLKKSQTIIRRADRLSSLGTLVASLAHEIRNPLVSIKTFTQLLPERIEDEEFRNYFLKVASGEIDRLTGLINELLGFARPTEPRLEGEDIHAIIDKMEVLIATEARKKNISLHKNYAPDLPQVRIDAEQIKQVLLNILLNAIQTIRGEGEIWIETRMVQVPLEEKIEPFIQVEVRDTGVGIPQENLERIFDPFFSTRPEGSGLGLAISHNIIHDHRGFIAVESEVAKGTSFKIHLPLKTGGIGVVQKQGPDIS